jgi:predicted nucleotidyltransferase component of viral defense system
MPYGYKREHSIAIAEIEKAVVDSIYLHEDFEATRIRHVLPITINKEEKPLLNPDFKTINPGMIYKDPDLHAYSLLVMNIKEIAAEKVRALLTRKEAKSRDLYDLWFLLSNNFSIDIGLVEKKMQFDHAVFSIKRLKARIKEIEPIWESDLKPLTKMLPSYEEAARIVLQAFA